MTVEDPYLFWCGQQLSLLLRTPHTLATHPTINFCQDAVLAEINQDHWGDGAGQGPEKQFIHAYIIVTVGPWLCNAQTCAHVCARAHTLTLTHSHTHPKCRSALFGLCCMSVSHLYRKFATILWPDTQRLISARTPSWQKLIKITERQKYIYSCAYFIIMIVGDHCCAMHPYSLTHSRLHTHTFTACVA